MKDRHRSTQLRGNALVPALLTMAVLAFIGLNTVSQVTSRYRTTFHSASWEDAFRAAESGIDIATTQLNSDSSTTTWNGFTASTALTNWQAPPYPNMATSPPPAGAYNYRSTSYSAGTGNPLPGHGGQGSTALFALVKLDALDGTGAPYTQTDYNNGAPIWYRLRSTGVAGLPGSRGVTYETSLANGAGQRDRLSLLRHLSFVHDKTGGVLSLPQVSRTVEVILQPTTANLFARSMTVRNTITLSGAASIDSYDSSDPAKSTGSTVNGVYYGLYDQAKRQSHGDIATNSAGNLSDLKNKYVYGSAYSNTQNYLNEGKVQGSKYTNFSTVLPPVSDPVWSSYDSSLTTINGTSATMTAGTLGTPAKYKLSQLSIGGGNVVTIKNPTPGTQAYVQVWVTGAMTTSGNSVIIVQPGVHVTFYVDGSTTVSGSGVDNSNGKPGDLVFYGVTPASGPAPTFTVSGSADFQGVVYAPAFDFVDSGNGDFSGAIVANSATISGSAAFHYDEALNSKSNAGNSAYQMVSWMEDFAQLAP